MVFNLKGEQALAVSSSELNKATQATMNKRIRIPVHETALRDVEMETITPLPYDWHTPSPLPAENRDIARAPELPRTVHSGLTPILARDFLTPLPPELVSHVLSFLPFNCIAQASRVSKSLRHIIESNPVLWLNLLKSEKLWFRGDSDRAFVEALILRRRRAGSPHPDDLSFANLYKILFESRYIARTTWIHNPEPR